MFDSLTAWIRANCPTVSLDVPPLCAASEAEQRGENYRLLVGAAATKVGHGFLIHRYGGEYFMFELSKRQAEALNALDPAVRFFHERARPTSTESRSCHLEHMEFEQDDSVDLTRPMKGACVCRFEVPRPEVCLHLETVLRLAGKPDQAHVPTGVLPCSIQANHWSTP
jgi:hypothetical protein